MPTPTLNPIVFMPELVYHRSKIRDSQKSSFVHSVHSFVRFSIDQILITLGQILETTMGFNIDTPHIFVDDFQSGSRQHGMGEVTGDRAALRISPKQIRLVNTSCI